MAHIVVKDKANSILEDVDNLLIGYKVKHSSIQIESLEEYNQLYKGKVVEL